MLSLSSPPLTPPPSLPLLHLQAAFNAFLTAGAHQVVREIQRGKVGEPSDVAAAAAEQEKERRQRAAAAAPPQHDWLLADRAVREGAAMAELKVGGCMSGMACVVCGGC